MIRALTTADLDAIDGLNPPDWPRFRSIFERYFTLPCCQPYGLEVDGRLVSMGTLIDFGSSAWVAQLITDPGHQGRGLGSKVLRFLIDEAARRGITTLSLVATEQGFPLYEKAGFRLEGWYDFWTRNDPAPLVETPGLRPWTSGDKVATAALDQGVTGEDRRPYWGVLTEGAWVAEVQGRVQGVFLPRFGEGLVIATTPEAGEALMAKRLNGAQRCVIPRENPAPVETLVGRGFGLAQSARRMVLGASLVRRPEHLWSRVGGNLG